MKNIILFHGKPEIDDTLSAYTPDTSASVIMYA